MTANHTHALEIRNLRFRYPGAQQDTVDIPQLTVSRGERILLTGASGRGKSTLLQLIAGLMDPDSGTILVDGQDVHALRGAKRDLFRGSKIGMVFQTLNLLQGFTAAENVMAALLFSDAPKREHRSRADELLETLGIDRPDSEVTELSIGQQQRVAVARAAATRPAVILADEPTASLDPDAADEAMNLVQHACDSVGAALVCTSHDPTMAERFERRESLDALASGAIRLGA
ncbi:MAG: ATP-binding cassette domain-containing protein [Planctomycetota bacterium]